MNEPYTKTCINCAHYNTLISQESYFHIHDYCSLFKAQIPSTVIFDELGCISGYDDIECGLAYCWGFKLKEGKLQEIFPNMEDNVKEFGFEGEENEILV